MPPPTVLVILAEGFEEMEVVTPVDVLRRAGAEVTIASIGEGIHVLGRSGLMLHSDTTLGAVGGSAFDCLLLPGGPGVKKMREDPRVAYRVKLQMETNGWIAAICAAPVILNDAGALNGRRFTAHHSVASELPEALLGERVIVDQRVITSRGAGTALDFALSIVGKLCSPEKAAEVALSIFA